MPAEPCIPYAPLAVLLAVEFGQQTSTDEVSLQFQRVTHVQEKYCKWSQILNNSISVD